MSQDATSGRAARRQSRRSQRIRTACLRCQQRKIRCDGITPVCTSCSKSNKECEYQDGSAVENQARARYLHHLEHRVRWLENIVKERCPDVDLTEGPDVESADNVNNTSISTSDNASTHQPDAHYEPLADTDVIDDTQDVQMSATETTVSVSMAPTSNPQHADSSLAHQIGLVSLPNGDDPRYIGPSSGHFFTQLVCTASALTRSTSSTRLNRGNATLQRDNALTQKLLRDIQTPLPSSKDLTEELTRTYFATVHQHLPFLHEPTHMRLIEEVYASDIPDPIAAFQVYMVLAISSIMLSRRDRVALPSEGWAAMAVSFFEKNPVESSTRGLQCLLLLHVWGMHSPATKLNIWYLNYQCIAMVVDLGLQRDVKSASSISPFDQEMRTRLFWVVYSLDRSLCTMMGRPIGLRDEACDLRLPTDIDDIGLTQEGGRPRTDEEPPTHMTYAIHLFKLAKLNSEMKYILHSISRETPAYAYPAVRCMRTWQRDMRDRLDQWAACIPQRPGPKDYVMKVCDIRYHVLKTLLLRPSPGIPQPSSDDLEICYASALTAIRLYHDLYVENALVFTWASYHSIMMSAVTAFFCIWTCPSVARVIVIDELVSDLRAASNILSATGEHWQGAKQSRNILDELSHRTIRWIMDRKNVSNQGAPARSSDVDIENPNSTNHDRTFNNQPDLGNMTGQSQVDELEALMQQYSRSWTPGLEYLPSTFDQMSDMNTGLWTGDTNTDAFLQDLFDGMAPMSF